MRAQQLPTAVGCTHPTRMGAEPAAQTPGEPNPGQCRGWLPVLGQIPLSPANPPKARACCLPGDTPSTKAHPQDGWWEQGRSSGVMSWGGGQRGCGALLWAGVSVGAPEAPTGPCCGALKALQAWELLLPALHHGGGHGAPHRAGWSPPKAGGLCSTVGSHTGPLAVAMGSRGFLCIPPAWQG